MLKKKYKPPVSRVFPPVAQENKGTLMLSVEKATARDIPACRRASGKKSVGRLLLASFRYTMLVASSLVFIGSCVALVLYVLSYLESNAENEFLSQIFNDGDGAGIVSMNARSPENVETLTVSRSLAGEVINVTYTGTEYNETFEKMRSKIMNLKRQNPDIWGWISIPNTNIDFPIMFSGDNEYYLTHSPTKSYNANGSIFADARTSPSLPDNRALVVYGHNMAATGSMFAQLIEYTREDVFNNRLITITTLDGIYTYEVFSVYDSSPTYNYIRTYFSSDQDFISFAQSCASLSLFRKDMTFSADDRLLTLSTCTIRQDNRRWAIHAKLIAVSK